ncbi:MAG: hypothetical protein H7288_04265 [Kineosporiaceae bacterium]|nr:hypothetical protein [Aeromicrobium sp.]
MADEALIAMAQHQGIDPDILRRWQAKEPLSAHDQFELKCSPEYGAAPDLAEDQRRLLDVAI